MKLLTNYIQVKNITEKSDTHTIAHKVILMNKYNRKSVYQDKLNIKIVGASNGIR